MRGNAPPAEAHASVRAGAFILSPLRRFSQLTAYHNTCSYESNILSDLKNWLSPADEWIHSGVISHGSATGEALSGWSHFCLRQREGMHCSH